jgi:carboxysome shell carbonic anhydrase
LKPHALHSARRGAARSWRAYAGETAPAWSAPVAVANAGVRHPLADDAISLELRRRADEIDAAFNLIEPTLRGLAPLQFDAGFVPVAVETVRGRLGLDLPPEIFAAAWTTPLDMRALHARCVLGTFCRLVARAFDRGLARLSDGEPAADLIRRWGFHAIDITPCADGRLSGVVDFILRIPPAIVSYRQSYAGAMFDVGDTLRHWEQVELGRWRDGVPNGPDAPTRFLKIGVYHFSSVDPGHQGCAAHGSDGVRAAGSLLERLEQFATAVRLTHGDTAEAATLLIGVDTDTDAVRVHVPDASGGMSVHRYVDNLALYGSTQSLPREGAKDAIRTAVAACAGVADDDTATEGMRWLCGYVLKNNIGQIDAVRAWYGGRYDDAGHTERLIVVGDPVDDVQLRNLAFQAQMHTVEEAASDLDVGIRILRGLHEPRGLAVPVLVHFRYDPRIPGAAAQAQARARRLSAAILARHAALAARGVLQVHAVVRAGDGTTLADVDLAVQPELVAELH